MCEMHKSQSVSWQRYLNQIKFEEIFTVPPKVMYEDQPYELSKPLQLSGAILQFSKSQLKAESVKPKSYAHEFIGQSYKSKKI